MVVGSYDELMSHKNHRTVVVGYGVPGQDPDVMAVECLVCGEVLFQYPRPQGRFDEKHIRSTRREPDYPNSTGVIAVANPGGEVYTGINKGIMNGSVFMHRDGMWQMFDGAGWTSIRAEYKPYPKTTGGATGVLRWDYEQGAS
jgi:hypothetical protein